MRRSHFHYMCAITSSAGLCIISYTCILPISMLTQNEKPSLTRLLMLALRYNLHYIDDYFIWGCRTN